MSEKPTYEELEKQALELEKARLRLQKTEKALRDSEARLNAFLDYSPVGFGLWDRKFRYVYINEVLRKINGPSLVEHIGHTIEEVLPEAAHIIRPLFEGILSSCKPVLNIELSGVVPSRPDQITHYLVSYFPVFIIDKTPQYIGGVVVDITERKQAEEDLVISNEATRRQNIVFAAINRLFKEAIACNTSTDVAKLCLNIAVEVTDSEYGSIAEINNRNRFNTLALSNPGWTQCRMAELDPSCIHDMEVRGIWGAALKSEHGLIVNDPKSHPMSVGVPEGHPALNAFLGMPFRHKNFNGMIGLAKRDGDYKDTDREIIESIALAFAEVINSKRAEEFLKESEERYRSLIESQTDLVCRFTSDGTFVFVNDIYCQFFNKPKVELIGYKWQPLSVDDDLELIKAELSKLSPANPMVTIENRVFSGKGEIHWMQFVNKGFFDPDGKLQEIQSVGRDITERKQYQITIEKSRERFRQLFNNAPVMNVITENRNQTPYIKEVNKTFVDTLGYKRDDLIGTPLDNYYTDASRKALFENGGYQRTLEGQFVAEERSLRTHNGAVVHTLLHAKPEYDDEGRIVGTLAIYLDITERKIALEEAKRLETALIHATKMESIGNLAGGIAHDFNNILSSIIGFTELTMEDVGNNTVLSENLQEVYKAGMRARDLVKQILAFARQSDEAVKPIQPGVIAKEVLKFIRSSIPSTIEIRQNIDSKALIMANATQVHQVLMNLCTNAAQAMEDKGGIIELILRDVVMDRSRIPGKIGRETRNYVEIKVSDNGVGIAPNIIDSIFEPYFTTKKLGEGTGLGLAMVHGIVESYGGNIHVDSKLGIGSVFTINLPVTKNHKERITFEPSDLPLGTEMVLFVDDELAIVNMGSQILKRLGYSVTARSSSVEALELFQAKPDHFDIVISDMTMPNMTGDQLAIEMIRIRPDIPVILCSGFSRKISGESATEIGIKAFINKPIEKVELAKLVRKVLDEAKGND